MESVMATSRPQRSPAEIEDIILRKIFLITLVDSMETDSRIVYLETTAAEILSQDKDLRLSRVLMERVLIDRLSGNFPAAESPFPYLVGCYRRAYDEGKKILNMRDNSVKSEMESVVEHAKKLAVSYCRMHLGNPDVFSDSDPNKSNALPSRLLPLLFSEVSGSVDGYVSSPPGFLNEFLKDSEYDDMAPILSKLYEDLRDSVLQESVLGNFQQPLRALLFLINSPFGAKCLVNHPCWIPKVECLNGRDIEMISILGPFFRLSALPDQAAYNNQQLSPFAVNKTVMSNLQEGLAQVVLCLLKNSETRDNVLEFLGEVINKNSSRANIQVDPETCASSGMFVNLSAVMLRLCEPFLDVNMTKLDKIDPTYVFYGTRLDLKGLTALHASTEEVVRMSSSSAKAKYTFISECFFMTARVLNLGILKVFSDYKHLIQDITRCKDDLSTLTALQAQTPSPQLDAERGRLQEELELLMQEAKIYDSEVINNADLIQRALAFYRLMVVWFVRLAGGFQMQPSNCPIEFAGMPEHFVEDAMELLIFSTSPQLLDGVLLDEFVNFIIMFMGSPGFIRNPYLRAKMVQVLNSWMRCRDHSSAIASLFEGDQLSLDYLVKSLLQLYVDAENDDKFKIRHDIAKLLEYLWKIPRQRKAWEKVAKEEEKGVYLNFLNSLINDTIYLVDGSLTKILELKEIEAEMANITEWQQRPAQEREEKTLLFHTREKTIRVHMKLANEDVNMLAFTSEKIKSPFLLPEMVERVASMLNYFLLKLVGPQRKSFSLKYPEKYEFRPKQLLKQIITIYVNLAKGDGKNVFANAIIKDGRSYNEQLFGDAADVLGKIGEDERSIQEVVELGAKAKFAADEALEAETALGEIPEEFLDPIQCTLMMDPVILPSSRNTVDRSVIQRHLLSNNTDPFNRSYLTSDMLIPHTELKARIDEFVRRSGHDLMSEDSGV